MWNLPNTLTILRIALIPVFIVIYYTSWEWHNLIAAAIFGAAAATDWVDGYLARKYNKVTPFGAFLDPVADKLIVVAAIIVLLEVHATPWFAIPSIIIIGREIVISALREWMAATGHHGTVAVAMIGKVKTWVQMVAIAVLLAAKPENELLTTLGFVAIYIAAALTLWSMLHYLRAAWPHLSAPGDR
jgi:CDP-diacylglycerol---glycerol-3-phosphate 3-phosphatidyltransferase